MVKKSISTNIIELNFNLEKIILAFIAFAYIATIFFINSSVAFAAACPAPTADFGTATQTVSIPTAESYTVWSRVMAPDSSNNSFALEIDGNTCLPTVGGSAVTPANTWVWVSNTVSFTASGNHSVKMIGTKAGVKVDRLIFTTATCTPTGTGGNCIVVADTTPPTINLTAPTEGETISGTKTLTATATDASGISKVEFYNGFVLINTDTTSPYSYDFNTTTSADGPTVIGAKSYDNAGNSSPVNSKANVTIANQPAGKPDLIVTKLTMTPTTPTAGQQVLFSATIKNQGTTATTLGVKHGAKFDIDGITVSWHGNDTTTSIPAGGSAEFTANNGPTGSQYWTATEGNHQLVVYVDDLLLISESDETNNTLSTNFVVAQPPDTQAPSVPTGITANSNTPTSVNVSWSASTDNVGVTGYWLSRNGVTIAQLGTALSYTDNNVSPSTTYSYQLSAVDGAGNASAFSAPVSVTTQSAPDTSPPTAPASLTATAVSETQINLSWTASTDNVGVVGYDVYRSSTGTAATKVASVSSTTYGNTSLSSSTAYTYFIIARDAAGLQSNASPTATATTQSPPPPPTIYGSISGVVSNSGGPINGATVRITINGSKYTYSTNSKGEYSISNLPSDAYPIMYNAKRVKPQTINVNVTSGQNTVQNVTL